MAFSRNLFAAVLTVVASLASGCGGGAVPATDTRDGPTNRQALDDLSALLKEVNDAKKAPPARQFDLEVHDVIHMSATLAITRKDVVYQWGSSLSGGQAVIAYEKDVPASGGYVLLQDGTVKSMTAAEFTAAPKAGKK